MVEPVELKAMMAAPERKAIEHVDGPLLGREILISLATVGNDFAMSRQDTHLQAQIKVISAALQLGEALVKDGKLKSW